jgi:transposase InsO family protein
MAWIASELAVSRATVSRVLKKEGLHRLSSLDPAPLPKRYERDHPGELLHLNVKKLARIVKIGHRMTGDRRDCTEGAGWEFAFVAVDDHSRLGFVRLFSDEKKRTAAAFLEQAAQYYRHLNLPIKRILTDNGPAFHSLTFADTCRRLRIRHSFTRLYRPQTNGKTERFIQSALREWAYGRPYRHSCERIHHLADWLHHYNWHRPHSSLSGKPPISRLGLAEDNVLRLHN